MTFSAQFEIVEFVSLIFMESDIQLIQTEFKRFGFVRKDANLYFFQADHVLCYSCSVSNKTP